MKQVEVNSSSDILQKIDNIEKEVIDLKLSILKKLSPTSKKIVSLKSILKGVNISEKDISKAKKLLYSKTGI
jgi:hypothetical protein